MRHTCITSIAFTLLVLSQESHSTIKPTLYYFEDECANGFENKATSYIGIEEQVRILTTRNQTYARSFSCYYTVRSSPPDRFMFYFQDLDMEGNECADDWMTFIDGDADYTRVIGNEKYCGTTKPYEVLTSSGHEMTIYFHSNSFLERKGFDIIVTVFHEGNCRKFETKCDNGRCIHGELQCNGYNSCGDYSACDGDRSEGNYIGIIIGGCVSVFFLVVIVVSIIVFVKCRKTPRRTPGIQGQVEKHPDPVHSQLETNFDKGETTQFVPYDVPTAPTYESVNGGYNLRLNLNE